MKKLKIVLGMALAAVASVIGLAKPATNVFADSIDLVGEISAITSSATNLGLPSTLSYASNAKTYNKPASSSFTLDGIKYTTDASSNITSAAVADDASTVKVIGFYDNIGGQSISQNIYTSITFSGYTAVETVIYGAGLPTWYTSSLGSSLSHATTMIVLNESRPPLSWSHSSSLENIILARREVDCRSADWASNPNFDLGTYPDGVKFVTCDSLKLGYGKAINTYKNHDNYDEDVDDLNIYVIPDTYFKNTLNIDPTGYQPEEYGGALWIKTTDGSPTVGYSIAYIDPCVTKVTADGTKYSTINPAIGEFDADIDTFYCKNGAPLTAATGIECDKLYGPVPDYLYSKVLTGHDNLYLYKGASTMKITTSNVSNSYVVTSNIYLANGVTVNNQGSNASLTEHITNGYSETFTPCVEIKVGSNKESSNVLTTTVAQLKENLTARLEAEAEQAEQEAIEQANREAAQAVDDLINNLPSEITLSHKTSVQAARTAYNALTVAQKTYVTKLNVLQNAEQAIVALEANAAQVAAYQAAAREVDSVIELIPSNITLNDKQKVQAARTAYNALSAEAKTYVENLFRLEAAEEAIDTLESERDDRIAEAQSKAATVDALIANIPVVPGLNDKAQIQAAREAYEELTGEAKTYVTKLNTLVKAENSIRKLEIAGTHTAQEIADMKLKAKNVDDLIIALPRTIGADCKSQVEECRIAYNQLTEDEKVYVEKLSSLETAEQTLRDLGVTLNIDQVESDSFADAIENFKAKLENNKGLKALTICLSIVFGFGLFYVVYVILRKLIKWLKK